MDAKPNLSHLSFFNEVFIPDEKHGFLPKKIPLQKLPEHSNFHVELNKLAHTIPLMLRTKTVKTEIDILNEKYKDILLELNTQQEKSLAVLMLAMLNQAYIFETPDKPKNIIPPVIGKNIEALCRSLQRFPILTYADYILNNWQLIDPEKDFTLENMEPIITLTGSRDEAWFIKIHLVIEAACAPALRSAYDACLLNFNMRKNISLQNKQNDARMIELLTPISNSLSKATTLLLRMKEQCDPEFFYHKLRPLLNGWDEKLSIQFHGDKSIHHYKGPSGAQSSILPVLDGALGIKHKIDGMYQHLLTFKQHMPHKHAFFINFIQLRSIELPPQSSDELVSALSHTVKSVQQFRYMHRFAMVSRYIYNPASKNGVKPEEILGTGGSPIGNYLEDRHRNTSPRSRL